MLVDVSKRSEEAELMDDFKGDLNDLRLLFNDINNVNAILGGSNITIKAITKLMREYPQEQYTIIDMGCGDGAMLRAIANYFRNQTINLRCIGIDLSKDILQLAQEASSEYDEIEYVQADILDLKAADFNADIVVSTLTMHHFKDAELGVFLKKFNQLASIGFIINDLHRSVWAYYLYMLFSLFFIKTKTAKIDGLISIKRSFIKSDLVQYSKWLPQASHTIQWKWAFRYLWVVKSNR